jgi:hypothetical protein
MQDQIRHRGTETKPGGIPARTYESDSGRDRTQDPETDQFRYDTPYDGGSVSDQAGINAAKEGKLVADKEDLEQVKEEVGQENEK